MTAPGPVAKLQRSFAYRVSKLFPGEFLRWIDAVSDFIDNSTTGGGAVSIDTVVGLSNSLRSIVPLGDVSAIVDGYTTRGDGGGGNFFWESTSVATDDSGTVINPTGHVGAGRWLRIYSGQLNVRWFGATGGGVIDDTAAIQATFDAATIGGRILFPLGQPTGLQFGLYKVTAPILYDSAQIISGEGKGVGSGGVEIQCTLGISVFKPRTVATLATRDVHFEHLTILNPNSVVAAGSKGIDFTGTDLSQAYNCSIRYMENQIYGKNPTAPYDAGFWNTVLDCELAGGVNGVNLDGAANSWKIIGGRINDNTGAGVRVHTTSGLHIQSAFERNQTGVTADVTSDGVTVNGTRFENNVAGAIINHGDRFSQNCNDCIDAGDYILDYSRRGVNLLPDQQNYPSARSGGGSGKNILHWGEFLAARGAIAGLADGLTLNGAAGVGGRYSIDTADAPFGGASQVVTLLAAGTIETVTASVDVIVGEPYSFSGWCKSNTAGTMSIRIGDAVDGGQYFNTGGFTLLDEWVDVGGDFIPTQSTIYITLHMFSSGGTLASINKFSGFKLEQGVFSTGLGSRTMQEQSEVVGANIVAAATIAPTYPNHHVTGATPIVNITVPTDANMAPKWQGPLRLVFDTAGATITAGGNVANAFTAGYAGQDLDLFYDSTIAKWYHATPQLPILVQEAYAALSVNSDATTVNTIAGPTWGTVANGDSSLSVTLTTGGPGGVGPSSLDIDFEATVENDNGTVAVPINDYFSIKIDATIAVGDWTTIATVNTFPQNAKLSKFVAGVAPGAHTVSIQWAVGSGTGRIRTAGGYASARLRVREIRQ